MASPPAAKSVPDRVLDGIAYVAMGSFQLMTSAVKVMSVATILWALAIHFDLISPSLPHFGNQLPYIGQITPDLALLSATISTLVFATLIINNYQ